jgi:nicotinate-nucleotide pyrophosphorylase (carboxylating)
MHHFITPIVSKIIKIAIEEDLGRGDVTTRLCTAPLDLSNGLLVAKENIVLSGLNVFEEVMTYIDKNTNVEHLFKPGDEISKGETIATVSGYTASLLMAERVALNFLQRLSGTATITRSYVSLLTDKTKIRLVDTRKTTPGMRLLERRAVLDGGGYNHRADLAGGILIKENHIAAAGGIKQAISLCKNNGPHPLKIEIEVTNFEELKEALEAKADIIMLDNMNPSTIKECVSIAQNKALLEVSGGINLLNLKEYAQTGVDIISVGAFTHSAPSADISFLIEKKG